MSSTPADLRVNDELHYVWNPARTPAPMKGLPTGKKVFLVQLDREMAYDVPVLQGWYLWALGRCWKITAVSTTDKRSGSRVRKPGTEVRVVVDTGLTDTRPLQSQAVRDADETRRQKESSARYGRSSWPGFRDRDG